MLCLAVFVFESKTRLMLVFPSAFTDDDTADDKLAVSLFRRRGLEPAQVVDPNDVFCLFESSAALNTFAACTTTA
jgi:hypothetical protein